MKKRILFGTIMIGVLVALLWVDWRLESGERLAVIGLPVAGVLVLLLAMAFIELARMSAAARIIVLVRSGMFGTIALATLPFWWQLTGSSGATVPPVLLVLSLAAMGVFVDQMVRHRIDDALRRIACTLLAVVYLGAGGAMIMWIRVAHGVPIFILFLAAVKVTDIGAYFTGSAIGRHKMIPWLSPGKSWEGLFGGLLAGAGASVLIVWMMKIDALSLWQAGLFGALVGAAGQFADLCESLLKRSARQKDSGRLVPHFGGVLDIIDSLLLGAPIAVVLLAAL